MDSSDHDNQTDQRPDTGADRVHAPSLASPTELPGSGMPDSDSVHDQDSKHPPQHLDTNHGALRLPEHQQTNSQEMTAQQQSHSQSMAASAAAQSILDLIAGLVDHAIMTQNNAPAQAAAGPSAPEPSPWSGLLTCYGLAHPQTAQLQTLPPLQSLLSNISGTNRDGTSTPATNEDHSQSLLLPLLAALVNTNTTTNASQESSPVETGARIDTATLSANTDPVIGSRQQYLKQGKPGREGIMDNDLLPSGSGQNSYEDHQDAAAAPPHAKRRKGSNDSENKNHSDTPRRDPRERRTPCRRRGMPDHHTIKTAYLVIPHNVRHGDNLECSIPECRKDGPRFRYCVICRSPVATCNFTTRHNHHPDEFSQSSAPYTSLGSSSSSSSSTAVAVAGLTTAGRDMVTVHPGHHYPSPSATPKPVLKPGTKKWAKDQVEAVVRVGIDRKEPSGQAEHILGQGIGSIIDEDESVDRSQCICCWAQGKSVGRGEL